MVSHKMSTEPVLQLIENGEWHNMKDIAKLTNLNSNKVEHVTKFLVKYNFAKLDKTKQKIILNQTTTKFFKMLQEIEQTKNKTCIQFR